MSVCSYYPSTCISSATTGQISIKYYAGDFYKDLFGKTKPWLKSDKKLCTLHEDIGMLYFYRQHTIAIKALLTVQHSGEKKLFMYNKSPPSTPTMRRGGLKYTALHM
jgi:hypothetical protein